MNYASVLRTIIIVSWFSEGRISFSTASLQGRLHNVSSTPFFLMYSSSRYTWLAISVPLMSRLTQ